MAWWLELQPSDRMVSGSGSTTVMLFPGKRVSVFLWTSLLIVGVCVLQQLQSVSFTVILCEVSMSVLWPAMPSLCLLSTGLYLCVYL